MKHYLGDGVYVEHTGNGDIVLTTEDGIAVTNRIYLQPHVYLSLRDYMARTLPAIDAAGTERSPT